MRAMITTRRTTIKIRPDLGDVDTGALSRLTVDELGELAEKIELETQHLNKIRRLVSAAITARAG